MPTSDFTSKLLELEDVIIEDVQTTNTEIHTFLSMPRRPHICPRCKTITEQIHDYRTSVIKDIPSMGKMMFLHYRKRRYHCPCCNKHEQECASEVANCEGAEDVVGDLWEKNL